ncbi:hypothetical protein AB0L40_12050 [Patulibacter sp. NPDC049589]|uniref:hypothetical protein n=1 Tax=Patulibacter sp. NPDC049589 TaxID=3154731 RepID=UPI00341885A6
MTDETTYPELDRLRAVHDEIPAPAPDATAAARERLRAAMTADGAGVARERLWSAMADDGVAPRSRDRRHDPPAEEAPRAAAPGGRRPAWAGRFLRRPGRRSVVFATAGLAVAAIVVTTTGLAGGGVDVVARAEAALSSGGPVVHVVSRVEDLMPDGRPLTTGVLGPRGEFARLGPTVESWATGSPLRFQVRQAALDDGRSVGYQRSGLTAEGSYWELDATGGGPPPRQDPPPEVLESVARSLNGGLGPDPTAGIRRLLAAGAFRSAGEETVRGRRARRLVADVEGPSGTVDQRTEYLVDADDFQPLEVRVYRRTGASSPQSTTMAQPATTATVPEATTPATAAPPAETTPRPASTTTTPAASAGSRGR